MAKTLQKMLTYCPVVKSVHVINPRKRWEPDIVTRLLAEIAVFGIAAGGLFWLVAAAGIERQPASENVFE
ncbi:hypothetical protein GGE45_002648 [Rhizobium aethiopicum]|uniref:Uncharacterized protein n=1 Tax=Rhizobium aethiopicum TaxID=1138170 RepID=A0A7W6MD18_9HYPH|nr:hypothetical protein [Rhizobium aethiopicum]MBB4189943.1 hypothetical protein [Rhizobium aethiopicum]MBB4580318.1 hypothetical protein [Rhizobium aethiopicum]